MSIPFAARFTCALAFLLVHQLAAQPVTSPPDGTAPLDSVQIAYDFTPGESFTYRVVTHDTLELFRPASASQPPMVTRRIAERAQFVTFTCVGVVEEGFLMEMTGRRYAARETRDTLPEIVRTTHPWVERTLRFSLTRDGRRMVLYSSPDTAGVAPGGPFQPLMLPLLGDSATWVGASQVFKQRHWLIDNAIPPSPWDGSILRIVTGRHDTLGLPTIVLRLDEIASVSHETDEPESRRVTTIASTSGASTHYFAPMLGFPVTGQMALVLKLDIRSPQGRAEGRQTLAMTYEMVATPALDTSDKGQPR